MTVCGWDDIDPSAADCCDWSAFSVAVQELALENAVGYMWAATGRRYGVCPVTVRPCQPDPKGPEFRGYPVQRLFGDAVGGSFVTPYIRDGQWRNCGCGPRCCCRPACQVELDGPVAAVTEVEVDGVIVDPGAYRTDVANGQWWLVRTDGTCWPTCQDLDENSGEGVFTVTYDRGRPIPGNVSGATSILACEMAKARTGDSSCRLNGRVATIARQGVTLELDVPDNTEIAYITGIDEVDRTIAAANPSRRASPPVLYSPDMPTAGDRVTVIPAGGSS